MATTQISKHREDRFVVQNSAVRVTVHRASRPDMSYAVTLVDLSRNGGKIQCKEQFCFEEKVILRIELPSSSIDIQAAGEVRWIRKNSTGYWVFGCRLDEGFPEETLQQLCEQSVIDRRLNERLPTDFTASCTKAGNSDRLPIRVTDISVRGLRFKSEVQFLAGEPVKVYCHDEKSDAEVEVICSVKWQRSVADKPGFEIGCLVKAQSAKDYHDLIYVPLSTPPSPVAIIGRRSNISFLLTALAIATCVAVKFLCF